MYSTCKEEKSVATEKFIRTLKTRFLSTWQIFQRIFILMCWMILLINTITQFTKQLKWNPLSLHLIIMLNSMKKILNLKLIIGSKYQNTKIFLLKYILKISQKKYLSLAKLKMQFHGLKLLGIWMVKKLMEFFMRKNCKKQIKHNSK